MGFRFQRRVKIAPGIRLNFSRRGISTTVGPRGASMNFGSRGVYSNVGIPGSGLSIRSRLDHPAPPGRPPHLPDTPSSDRPRGADGIIAQESITSSADLSSASLSDLAAEIESARKEISELHEQERKTRASRRWASVCIAFLWTISLGGFLGRKKLDELKQRRATLDAELATFPSKLDDALLDIEPELSDEAAPAWARVRSTFLAAAESEKIWDVLTMSSYDQVVSRTAAATGVTRASVSFQEGAMPSQPFSSSMLRMGNSNGPELFWSPAFIATSKDGRIALTDLAHVESRYTETDFTESGPVPSDARVIGQAWAKSNKNGTPDRRFKDNYQIPRVAYGTLLLRSSTGLYESYLFSDEAKAADFASALQAYLALAQRRSPAT